MDEQSSLNPNSNSPTNPPQNMQSATTSHLPDDFLRSAPNENQTVPTSQLDADAEFARQLQEQERHNARAQAAPRQQQAIGPNDRVGHRTINRLNITICEAKLNKSYVLIPGINRMDPYCRIRVGHSMYQTHTHVNGDMNPVWDKTIMATLPAGITELFVEIFDEKSFSEDKRIAWGVIELNNDILINKKTVTKDYLLSGDSGDNSEGNIKLVISLSVYRENVIVRNGRLDPSDLSPAMGQLPPAVQIRDEDIEQIREMFPNIDKETIRSVLVSKGGDKEMTIGTLLSMT